MSYYLLFDFDKTSFVEPIQDIALAADENEAQADDDLNDAVKLWGSMACTAESTSQDTPNYCLGENFDWNCQQIQIPNYSLLDVSTWLQSKIDEFHIAQDEKTEESFDTNKSFPLHLLKNDKKKIAFKVLSSIKEWTNNPSTHVPLRLTVSGKAGVGKTTLIDCIVSAIKSKF